MSVTVTFPKVIEDRLRAASGNIEAEVAEMSAVELFRRGKLTHFELSQVLGLDRVETDVYLSRNGIFEGSLTSEDIDADVATFERPEASLNMAVVVADTSPIVALVNLGCVDILEKLFGRVLIPPQVESELARNAHSPVVAQWVTNRPAWLAVQSPIFITPIAGLHSGETAAIALAIELGSDLLLIDEQAGRQAAAERHLAIMGTIGILEAAAKLGLVDLADAFSRLPDTGFWVSRTLLAKRLRDFKK